MKLLALIWTVLPLLAGFLVFVVSAALMVIRDTRNVRSVFAVGALTIVGHLEFLAGLVLANWLGRLVGTALPAWLLSMAYCLVLGMALLLKPSTLLIRLTKGPADFRRLYENPEDQVLFLRLLRCLGLWYLTLGGIYVADILGRASPHS